MPQTSEGNPLTTYASENRFLDSTFFKLKICRALNSQACVLLLHPFCSHADAKLSCVQGLHCQAHF